MKKIGICTVYTGFNYGSALQAYATKTIIKELGYEGNIFKISGSIISGRDVRFKKLLLLGCNMLLHFNQISKIASSYSNSEKKLSDKSKENFFSFYKERIQPVYVTEKILNKNAKLNEYIAFICGSDQVWNSTTYYVDPFYYLRFAPCKKRIAFAPSFGRSFIPEYNYKKIKKYINDIPYLSVRESSGADLIYDLTGKEAIVLLDPTLVIEKKVWCKSFDLLEIQKKEKYTLAYFLDEPSQKAKKMLYEFKRSGYKIIALPYVRDGNWFDECADAGPIEFLNLLLNATVVCTDSFHGTAFSLNFEKIFYVFERNYKSSANQSSRIVSILEKVGLMNRFDTNHILEKPIDFTYTRDILAYERNRSRKYLVEILNKMEGNENEF